MRSSSWRDLASMAKAIDGSCSFTGGYSMTAFLSQSVSLVSVSRSLATAPMSPACNSVQGGCAEHGEDAALQRCGAEAFQNVLDGQGTLFEVFFHEGVIALGHHFDQRFVPFLRRFGEVGWDFSFLPLAVAIGRVGVGLH